MRCLDFDWVELRGSGDAVSQAKPIPLLDFDCSSFSALVLGGGLPLIVRELPRKKFFEGG